MIKQTLGWACPKLRAPAAADRWTWLVIAAHTQLRLLREAAADLRHPWERPADPRLCAAIVDRLTFGGNIIQTGTESYRLAHTKTQADQAKAG